MSLSRRRLLQQSVLAAAACAAGALPMWAAKPQSNENSALPKVDNGLKPLDRTAFEATVGSGFRVTTQSGKPPVWLRLLAVNDLPALAPVNTGMMAVPPPKQKSAPVQTSGFMLSFLDTQPESLPQGTYTFEHAQLGKFSLLIVPEGGGQQTYTAVINRLP